MNQSRDTMVQQGQDCLVAFFVAFISAICGMPKGIFDSLVPKYRDDGGNVYRTR